MKYLLIQVKSKISYKIPVFLAKYLLNIKINGELCANVNTIFGIFTTHSFTNSKPHTSSRMIITPIIIILARLCRVNMKPVPGGGSASPAATKTNILIGVGLTSSRHTQWGQLFSEIEFIF